MVYAFTRSRRHFDSRRSSRIGSAQAITPLLIAVWTSLVQLLAAVIMVVFKSSSLDVLMEISIFDVVLKAWSNVSRVA